jgi:hypothetical protein
VTSTLIVIMELVLETRSAKQVREVNEIAKMVFMAKSAPEPVIDSLSKS